MGYSDFSFKDDLFEAYKKQINRWTKYYFPVHCPRSNKNEEVYRIYPNLCDDRARRFFDKFYQELKQYLESPDENKYSAFLVCFILTAFRIEPSRSSEPKHRGFDNINAVNTYLKTICAADVFLFSTFKNEMHKEHRKIFGERIAKVVNPGPLPKAKKFKNSLVKLIERSFIKEDLNPKKITAEKLLSFSYISRCFELILCNECRCELFE